MDTMDGSRSTSQQITSLLGTDDWVIVSLGDRLYTDSELDTIEAEREPVVVDDAHLRGRWSNGDPVHVITDGVDRWIAPNHNGATWIPEGQ